MNSIELQQGNKRIEWIDCVKGLGIFLVYIGHTYIPSVNGLIYSFHMPLFFIISGFLWNDSKYKSMPFRVFITTKFRAYILPYLKIASICFVVWGIIYGLFRFDSITDYFKQLLDYLYGIVIVYARRDYMPECSPIWFLVALFFAEMLFYFAKKTRIISLIVLLSAIVGYGSSRIGINPFCLGTAFSVMPFIFVGNCIKNNQWLFKHKLLTGIVGGGILVVLYLLRILPGADFAVNSFNPLIYIWASIITILIILVLSSFPPGRLMFSFGQIIGTNTLVLMGYNYSINMIADFLSMQVGTWGRALFVLIIGFLLALFVYKFPNVKEYIQ